MEMWKMQQQPKWIFSIKKIEIEFLEMKTTISEMKNSVDGIRHKRVEEEKVSSGIFLGQTSCIVHLFKT